MADVAAPVYGSAVVCDNCRRADWHPRPARVALVVEGRISHERRLCSACLRHVIDQAIRQPADWIGPPPSKVRA